jgi:hypothetical protein
MRSKELEVLKQMCTQLESEVGCFRSSEGFSQATPICGASPRLILLPFGGIPNPKFQMSSDSILLIR